MRSEKVMMMEDSVLGFRVPANKIQKCSVLFGFHALFLALKYEMNEVPVGVEWHPCNGSHILKFEFEKPLS